MRLTEQGKFLKLEEKALISRQNEPFNGYQMVVRGFIGGFLLNEEGVERFTNIVAPGNFLYEERDDNDPLLFARLEVLQPGWALQLPIEFVEQLLHDSGEFTHLVRASLSAKAKHLAHLFYYSHERNMEKKVGYTLALMMSYCKSNTLPINAELLAGFIGMSRNTVAKAMRTWQERGVLVVRKGFIHAPAPERFGLTT